jgi:hypothetical protein
MLQKLHFDQEEAVEASRLLLQQLSPLFLAVVLVSVISDTLLV